MNRHLLYLQAGSGDSAREAGQVVGGVLALAVLALLVVGVVLLVRRLIRRR